MNAKKTGKRLLSAALCSLLVLSGCSGSNEPAPSAPESAPAASSAPASSAAAQSAPASSGDAREKVGDTYVTGLPVTDEVTTFTVAVSKHTFDKTKTMNEKAAFIQAEADTNIHIDWIEVLQGSGDEKVNIMLATDPPDAFIGLLNENMMAKNTSQFVDLSEEGLLETFAPHIVEQYNSELPEAWDMLKFPPDGKIYSLMTGMQTNYENDGEGIQFINKVWLDKLGLSIPKTTEEYYNVLKAFKEKDPNGNGAADEIPITFCQEDWCSHITEFSGPWGITGYYKIENGQFIPTVDKQEYRDFLTFYHQLAVEGLLDVEGFSQTSQQYFSKQKERLVGTFNGWVPSGTMDDETAAEYVVLPPMSAPGMEGKQVKIGRLNKPRGNRLGFAITTACPNKEALLRWWDYLSSSTEMKYIVRYGEEGTLWETRDDGKVYRKTPQNLTEDFTMENMKYTYGMVDGCPLINLSEIEIKDAEKDPGSLERDRYVDQVKDFFPKEFLPIRFVDSQKASERAFIETELNAYLEQFIANSIVSGIDDASWEAHLQQLQAYDLAGWAQWYQDFIDGKF